MPTTTARRAHGVIAAGALKRDLHVASPALAGKDVLALQRALVALGYAPGEVDGIYGPQTATAVRAFQLDHGLEVDGYVGPKTRAALRNAKPGRRNGQPNGSVGAKALAEALRHVGVKETPVNRTSFGRWFGVDGVPWCNTFVSYCFKVGAGYTICAGHRGPGVYAKGCTYVPTTEAWLRASGLWVGRTSPRPGDIAIFNWDGGVPDHIGLVVKDLGGGRFESVEGNTSTADNSNGGCVMRRNRSIQQVNGFGRVR